MTNDSNDDSKNTTNIDDSIKTTYVRQGTSTTTTSTASSNCTTSSIEQEEEAKVENDSNNNNHNNDNNQNYYQYEYEYPIWYKQLIKEWDCEQLIVNEFDESDINTNTTSNIITNDNDYENHMRHRKSNGWKGCDLIHNRYSPVRILQYYVKYGNGDGLPAAKTTITTTVEHEHEQPTGQSQRQIQYSKGGINTCLYGIVQFTKNCESHKNYCHGGSMCSVFDDIIGWTGFIVTGQCIPWCGYTVQINTKLYQPIVVNSTLAIISTIIKIERRKIYIVATLYNPSISLHPTIPIMNENDDTNNNKITDKSIHATCEGIFVINKDVL